MKTLLSFFGALAGAACLLALPPASTAAYDQPRAGGPVVHKNDWTPDRTSFVQGPGPYYNLYTGRPLGDGRPQYNPLTGNYQWPGEIFNLYTGRPVTASPPYYPYTGTWGYQYGNGWGGNQPFRYMYSR